MAGVSYGPFENVDIFGLLALDPRSLRHLPFGTVLKTFQVAYRKAILRFHPDRTGMTNSEPAQQLNALKDFLCGFNDVNPARVTKLVERGCQNQRSISSACLNWKTPLRQTASPPGSSPSNPIVIDAAGISTTNLGSSSNPIVLDVFEINAATPEQGRNRSKSTARRRKERRKEHRIHRRTTGKAYDPSQGSRWRPAPYADQSDVESVWEQDWDSDDVL